MCIPSDVYTGILCCWVEMGSAGSNFDDVLLMALSWVLGLPGMEASLSFEQSVVLFKLSFVRQSNRHTKQRGSIMRETTRVSVQVVLHHDPIRGTQLGSTNASTCSNPKAGDGHSGTGHTCRFLSPLFSFPIVTFFVASPPYCVLTCHWRQLQASACASARIHPSTFPIYREIQ